MEHALDQQQQFNAARAHKRGQDDVPLDELAGSVQDKVPPGADAPEAKLADLIQSEIILISINYLGNNCKACQIFGGLVLDCIEADCYN